MAIINKYGRALLTAAAAAVAVTLGCVPASEEPDPETWGAWTVTTPATCDADGVETRTSNQNANRSETRPIPQLPESACTAPPPGDNTDHIHTWGAWVTVTPATCSAEGVEVRVCTQDANHSETRSVPQLPETSCGAPDDGDNPGDGDGDDQYESVTAGGKKWMKYNLNITTENSWCLGGKDANCDKYGRLYTWEAAKTACPTGWRLPSRQEWQGLVDAADGAGAGSGRSIYLTLVVPGYYLIIERVERGTSYAFNTRRL